MPRRKKRLTEGDTARAYAAARAIASEDSELRELLSAAEARVVPLLTEPLEEARLKALVAIVRERTREEDLKAFRAAVREYERSRDLSMAHHLAPILSKAVLMVRERQRKATASKAGAARQPAKKAAKAGVKALWLERQAGKHPRLRTNEQFAMECLRRWPKDLQSAKTILGWCTRWRKELQESLRTS